MLQLKQVDEQEVWKLIEENAVQGCAEWHVWPKLKVLDFKGVTFTMTSVPFPLFNSVLRADIKPEDVLTTIRYVQQMARQMLVPVTWVPFPSARPADLSRDLAQEGFQHYSTNVGMAIDMNPVQVPQDSELIIKEVTDHERLKEWSDHCGAVFELPQMAIDAWLELHLAMGMGAERSWRHFLGHRGEELVCAGSVFQGIHAAAIANLAVSGSNEAADTDNFCRQLMGKVRDRGYEIATCVTTPDKQLQFESLGMTEYFRIECMAWSPTVPDASSSTK